MPVGVALEGLGLLSDDTRIKAQLMCRILVELALGGGRASLACIDSIVKQPAWMTTSHLLTQHNSSNSASGV